MLRASGTCLKYSGNTTIKLITNRTVNRHITLFIDVLAYRSMHQSNEQSYFLYNDSKHIVTGHNLSQLMRL